MSSNCLNSSCYTVKFYAKLHVYVMCRFHPRVVTNRWINHPHPSLQDHHHIHKQNTPAHIIINPMQQTQDQLQVSEHGMKIHLLRICGSVNQKIFQTKIIFSDFSTKEHPQRNVCMSKIRVHLGNTYITCMLKKHPQQEVLKRTVVLLFPMLFYCYYRPRTRVKHCFHTVYLSVQAVTFECHGLETSFLVW